MSTSSLKIREAARNGNLVVLAHLLDGVAVQHMFSYLNTIGHIAGETNNAAVFQFASDLIAISGNAEAMDAFVREVNSGADGKTGICFISDGTTP